MSSTSDFDLIIAVLKSDIIVKTKEIENIRIKVDNLSSMKETYPDLYMKGKKFYSNEVKYYADKAYMDLVGRDGDRINVIPYLMHFSNSELYNIYYDCYIHIGNIYDNGIELIPNWKDKIINCEFTYAKHILESIVFQLSDKIKKETKSILYEQEILEEKIQLLKNINLE